MPGPDESIEIVGREVNIRVNGIVRKSFPVSHLVESIRQEKQQQPRGDIFPDGLKYWQQRGDITVVLIEQTAMPRTVHVIAEDSPASEGTAAKYVRRTLSFPYIYLLIAFAGPSMLNCQQLFYRNRPLQSLDDPLFLSNMLNVSTDDFHKIPNWLCLQGLHISNDMPFGKKIRTILDYIWNSSWNKSIDVHGGVSQFMVMKDIDHRISSFPRWEAATREDPYFMLKIDWKPAGMTVRQAFDRMYSYFSIGRKEYTSKWLINQMIRYSGKQDQI